VSVDFNAYQRQALETDQVPGSADTMTPGVADEEADKSLLVPMLGLAGEVGELLSEYKKHLRDGPAHRLFQERVAEELGDLLWYIANVASKFEIALDDVANGNLEKIRARWAARHEHTTACFDNEFPESERLPRRFELRITQERVGERTLMRAEIDGESLGDPLTDNAHAEDGYRFHDVFHVAYAAFLGWSPVTRANLHRKRKSNRQVDEVEDGGRAAVIEEGISALVFNYARDHNWLEGVSTVDHELLRTIKGMTSHLEVAIRTTGDWEAAILKGYEVFRAVSSNGGGRIAVDLDARQMKYTGG
jgi:NTP pyrophosphatase (non-canonical NTP hydrolase)